MENKPIVTCECPRAPGPAASWSGGVAGLLPPGLPPPPGAPSDTPPRLPGSFGRSLKRPGRAPEPRARNGGRRARLSPGLESRPSARIGLLPGVLGSAGRGSRSGKLPPATAASPSTPAVVHRHRQCRPARRARSALRAGLGPRCSAIGCREAPSQRRLPGGELLAHCGPALESTLWSAGLLAASWFGASVFVCEPHFCTRKRIVFLLQKKVSPDLKNCNFRMKYLKNTELSWEVLMLVEILMTFGEVFQTIRVFDL